MKNQFMPGCPVCGDTKIGGWNEVKCSNGHSLVEVFDLEDEPNGVSCYFCMERQDHKNYQKGEAFLAGADHTPWDANANYICVDHLDTEAVVYRDGTYGYVLRGLMT